MRPLCFIDCETTGLDPYEHEIIEIAIVKVSYGQPEEIYHAKIKPLHLERANPKALQINGYNDLDWKYAIDQATAAADIKKLLNSCSIVGHNPHFDMGFIRELWSQNNVKCWVDPRFIDTIVLAHEHLIPAGLKSCSLDSIRQFLRWDMVDSHTALKDAQDAKRLYYLLIRANVFQRIYWKASNKLRRWIGLIR